MGDVARRFATAAFAGAVAAGAFTLLLATAQPPSAVAATCSTTVEAPLLQAGAPVKGTVRKASSKSTSGALGKTARKKLSKRITQAIESMRTVKSARAVKISSFKIKISHKNANRIARVVGDVVNFHPEYFYVSGDITLLHGSSGCYRTLQLNYAYKFGTLKKRLAKCEKGLAQLLAWVPRDADDVQKVKAVHDWLVRNCIYGADELRKKGARSPYNIYGALVVHKPVCQGYALTFLLAMQQLGIKATCAGQYIGGEGHMWNRVKVGGHWYNVDVTFDDPYVGVSYSYRDGGFYATPSTRYFMKSDAWWKRHCASGGWHKSWYPKGHAGASTTFDAKSDWETFLRASDAPSVPMRPIVAFGDYAMGTRLQLGSGKTAAVYQVLGPDTVAYRSCAVAEKARSAKVPNTVKRGKRTFRVVKIARGAFAGRSRVRTVTVSAKGLEPKRTKGCLAGSKVRVVKVPASRKSAYKRCFAKAISGRSVKVR